MSTTLLASIGRFPKHQASHITNSLKFTGIINNIKVACVRVCVRACPCAVDMSYGLHRQFHEKKDLFSWYINSTTIFKELKVIYSTRIDFNGKTCAFLHKIDGCR